MFLTEGVGIIYSKYWLQINICRLSKHAIIIYIVMKFYFYCELIWVWLP
jgi:hypothetical protein